MTPPVEQRVLDLRLDRRALRAEQARVGWWRRLVRARMDLAVASAAQPQPLGEEVAFHLPPAVGVDVPRPSELGGVLAGVEPQAEVGRLDELRALDAQLARYEAGVRDALGAATERLIARLATDPATTTARMREPLTRG
ncbi:hypothetical protein [Cellulomonas rhizosphaerae]|uniref:Uncharacterized protein n=1 Tax=Cellulomonas rhizosphaerae TaxID=2293719 RepID=A0A413RNB2_9CELL|nr:hypothetical protein [Cellulomonas rhizosphaerae]RHA43086.1 hypothetical protein D1825_06565 [Cellulomonas rhizosphaerae]